jgi:hypothetical protein
MSIRTKKFSPALKHGGYSATALLPGEDPAAFEKLHTDLVAELVPNGPLEGDAVATIARLLWRKQNIATFRAVAAARDKWSEALNAEVRIREWDRMRNTPYEPDYETDGRETTTLADVASKYLAEAQRIQDNTRKELGEAYEFVEIGDIATLDQLMKDLAVEERLDSMIDKYLKRLLFLKGLKSLSPSSQTAPPVRRQKLLRSV